MTELAPETRQAFIERLTLDGQSPLSDRQVLGLPVMMTRAEYEERRVAMPDRLLDKFIAIETKDGHAVLNTDFVVAVELVRLKPER